jgi:hypothetical protein
MTVRPSKSGRRAGVGPAPSPASAELVRNIAIHGIVEQLLTNGVSLHERSSSKH